MAAVILDTFNRADTTSGLGTASSGTAWAGDVTRFRILNNAATGLETADGFYYAYLTVPGITGVTSTAYATVSVPAERYRVGVAYLGSNLSQEALVVGVFNDGGGGGDRAYLSAVSDTLPDLSISAPIPNPGTGFILALLQVVNEDGTATVHLLIDGESVLRQTVSAAMLAEWAGVNRVGIHLAELDGINNPDQVTIDNFSYDLAPNVTPPSAGLLDDFDRADAATLGTASNGLTWQGDATSFQILTNQAAPNDTTLRRAWLDTAAALIPAPNEEITADVEIPVIPTGDFQVGIDLHGIIEVANRVTLLVGRVGGQTTASLEVVSAGVTLSLSETALVLAPGVLQLRMLTQNNQRLFRAYLADNQVFETSIQADLTPGLDGGVQVGLAFDGSHADTSDARFDALRSSVTFVPQLLVDDVFPLYAPPGASSASIYQAFTSNQITDQPYIEYPVNSVFGEFVEVSQFEQTASTGDVTPWLTFYSRFQRITPMATFFEVPDYIPPDVEPEPAPDREESFSNRAGIRLEIWDQEAPNTNLLAVMARSRNRSWVEQLNGTGAGSFEIHLDDPVLTDHPDLQDAGLDPRTTILKYGNIVKIALDGIYRMAFVIEALNITRVGSGEESDRWVRVSGRGVMALFESAVVYPEYGFDPKSRGDKRLFTFVANEYEGVIDDGSGLGYENFGWKFAAELKAQFDVATSPWIGSPEDWPLIAQNALWIWDEVRLLNGAPNRSAPAPIGFVYFLKRFFIENEEDLAFFASADDAFQIYLDGQPLMEAGGTFAWRETFRRDIKVPAGHHLIAVRCENVVRPQGESPAGFIFAMAALGQVENTVRNEKVTLTHHASGGTYTITVDGQTTAPLAYNANRFDVTAALQALSTVGDNDVYVIANRRLLRGGEFRNDVIIEFAGPDVRFKDVPDVTWDPAALTGGTRDPEIIIQQGGVFVDVEPAELLLVSDKTWRVIGYPEEKEQARFSPPAFPPGAVLRFLLEEARARGVRPMQKITRRHTDYKGTTGEPFEVVVDTAFDIGMDLLQVIQRLTETSVDVYVSPFLELFMWKERGERKDQQGNVEYVELIEGKNLGQTAYDDRGVIKNSLLVRTQSGWEERGPGDNGDAGVSDTIYGRREAFLTLGNAPSKQQVDRTLQYAFSLTALPNSSTNFVVVDTQKVQEESLPYRDFNVGDWIVAPDIHGIRRSRRVVGIGVSEDENGNVAFSIELSNPRDIMERRLERWLEAIQLGTLRGSIAAASEVSSGFEDVQDPRSL